MRRFLTFTVILTSLAIAASECLAADEVSGELVGLNVSLAAEKQLVVFDQLVAAEEWIAAIDLLDRLKVDSSSVLVKVAPGRFVGLPAVIQQRLCRLPAGGLEVYRRRHNSAAATLLSRARAEHDPVDQVTDCGLQAKTNHSSNGSGHQHNQGVCLQCEQRHRILADSIDNQQSHHENNRITFAVGQPAPCWSLYSAPNIFRARP